MGVEKFRDEILDVDVDKVRGFVGGCKEGRG